MDWENLRKGRKSIGDSWMSPIFRVRHILFFIHHGGLPPILVESDVHLCAEQVTETESANRSA